MPEGKRQHAEGSSPQARITDAGYRTRYTDEIVYWGPGSAANPSAAIDSWMGSPAHRAIILNCAYTAAGFATAWDGNKMTAVGDFEPLKPRWAKLFRITSAFAGIFRPCGHGYCSLTYRAVR